MPMDGRLVARPLPDAVPSSEPPAPIRAVIASLARGGAERIVLDWLAAEARRGRACELAILHARPSEYPVPPGVLTRRRPANRAPIAFADDLASAWRDHPAPIALHLVPDDFAERLARTGLAVMPVLHNTREGWRNDPARWQAREVPVALACAAAVEHEARRAGCQVPLATIRHAPPVGAASFDAAERSRIRHELGAGAGTLVVGMAGALKPQKDYGRAIETLARLRARRDAMLVILGGALDAAGLGELDRIATICASRGLAPFVRLPGAVQPVEPWLAAFDAFLNTSRHEGLSMATREALAAGLPVVATDVGGQSESRHPRLALVAQDAGPEAFVDRLAALPVRGALVADESPRHPRAWSVPLGLRRPGAPRIDTLLATANLNAGGAQRSLVNLARSIAPRHRIAIAVAGETTHPAFAQALRRAGVEHQRVAATADPFEVAESLLAQATSTGTRTLCFWNLDARAKLLAARFAPPSLRLVDASPGAYGWREMQAASAALADTIAFGADDYHRRLDALVTKFDDPQAPPARSRAVIPNGVGAFGFSSPRPTVPRFLVRGRLAPSKRLEIVIEAFRFVAASLPEARLVIAGQAEPRHAEYVDSLRDAAEGLAIDWLGARPDDELLAEPFTAAVVLGTHQGCPNAVLEAMSAGIPVIANASGGTGELVADGRTGWLVAEDATAVMVAAAMQEAVADDAKSRAFAGAARELVRERHSLEAMAVRYLSVFESRGTIVPATESLGYPELRPA